MKYHILFIMQTKRKDFEERSSNNLQHDVQQCVYFSGKQQNQQQQQQLCWRSLCVQWPEALVEGVLVFVAPVLQVDAEAVLALAAQVMDVVVSQPELGVQVAETVPVVPPAAVEAHRAILAPLYHRPAASWEVEGGQRNKGRTEPKEWMMQWQLKLKSLVSSQGLARKIIYFFIIIYFYFCLFIYFFKEREITDGAAHLEN